MKIYEIGTGYTPIPAKRGAATEIVVEELTRVFIRHGLPAVIVDIAAPDRGDFDLPVEEVPVPPAFSGTDVQLGLLHKAKRVVYSTALAGTLKRLIRGQRGRIILHFHNQYNMFFFLMLTPGYLRRRCLLAYTNHSYIWHGDWDRIAGDIRKKYFQEVYCMRHADRVYVLNGNTEKNIREHLGIPGERIVRTDNGVNTERYRPLSEKEKELAREKYSLKGKKVFLQVGSVCDRKNQLGALQLLEPVLKKNRDAVFVYAGGLISGEYQDSILAFAASRGLEDQVRYLGELEPGEGLNELYNTAEALVFPSRAEGFSLVILEAMSAGVPVLIPDTLEFRLADECIRYGDAGDFGKLTEEMILDEDRQRDLSGKARRAVLKEYSWERIAAAYYRSWRK